MRVLEWALVIAAFGQSAKPGARNSFDELVSGSTALGRDGWRLAICRNPDVRRGLQNSYMTS
jgi:hypothetical protein